MSETRRVLRKWQTERLHEQLTKFEDLGKRIFQLLILEKIANALQHIYTTTINVYMN